jgi:hypothetical protein
MNKSCNNVGVVLGFGAVVSHVDANVSEKHAVSIIRNEVTELGNVGLIQSLRKGS